MAGVKSHSIVLLDGNAVLVFDIAKRAVVFKAKYADATDNITKLFSLSNEMALVNSVSPSLSQALQLDSPPSADLLEGFLLLMETKLVQKESTKSKTSGGPMARSKHVKKLHLVKFIKEEIKTKGGGPSRAGESRDRFEQIDALSFGEESAKLVDFVSDVQCYQQGPPPSNSTTNATVSKASTGGGGSMLSPIQLPSYLVFMLDRERVKSNGLMKLITVKIKWAKEENDDHKESDNSFDGAFSAT
jgi:hypothetical protein